MQGQRHVLPGRTLKCLSMEGKLEPESTRMAWRPMCSMRWCANFRADHRLRGITPVSCMKAELAVMSGFYFELPRRTSKGELREDYSGNAIPCTSHSQLFHVLRMPPVKQHSFEVSDKPVRRSKSVR